MKKISEEEENEMYNIIKTALFSLCDEKPNHPVDYLAKKMLELVDGTKSAFISRKTIMERRPSTEIDEYLIKVDTIRNENYSKQFLDFYRIIHKVNGDVYLIEDLKVPELKKVAKIINKEKTKLNGVPENILDILLSLDHPNVTKTYEILEDEYHLYAIEEFCEGGNLFDFILKINIFSEGLVKNIIKQLIEAIVYLNSKGIVHTNIKPENILIFRKCHVSNLNDINIKISDFSSANLLSSKNNKTNTKLISTPYYLSPEVIESNFNELCDLWSIGAITYTLLRGEPPFNGKPYEVLFKILHENIKFKDFPSNISEKGKDMISSLMNRDLNKRVTAKSALQHPWFTTDLDIEKFDEKIGVDIINRMSKFVMGKNLKRSVLSFIQSKKFYAEKNIDLQKLFKEIDKDGNGYLDVEEIFEKYGKFFPGLHQEAWEKVKQFIEKIDINDNGVIEYSEFLTISSLINNEINENMLKEVFNFYDRNGNGYVTADDLKEIFEETDMKDEIYQYMVDEIDKNNDGKITFQEFCQMITNIN